jgi:UDP-glucose 4-epimerase
MKIKWLITGGCGFIGTRLIKSLMEEQHHQIRILDNLSVGTRKDLGTVCNFKEKNEPAQPHENRPELWVGDIKDKSFCIKAAQGMDVIVHLAANTGVGPSVEDPEADMKNKNAWVQEKTCGLVFVLFPIIRQTSLESLWRI